MYVYTGLEDIDNRNVLSTKAFRIRDHNTYMPVALIDGRVKPHNEFCSNEPLRRALSASEANRTRWRLARAEGCSLPRTSTFPTNRKKLHAVI